MLKSGIYDFVICRGGTGMCFVLGFGRKRPDLKQPTYRPLQLCCLEVLSDNPDPVFCLLDHIWTEQLPLTCLGPVQRCLALPAIQDLKGGCLQTCLIAVIVRELSVGQAFFPLHAK